MSVWCLIIEHDRTIVGGAFGDKCSAGLDVDDLRTQVATTAPDLAGVTASHISVYHSAAIDLGLHAHRLQTAVSNLDLTETWVRPSKLVSEVVSGEQLLIFQKPAPPKQLSLKRPLSPSVSDNEYECLSRAKVARVAPSKIEYLSLQADPEERILDDRPCRDTHIAPIALLYRPFGEFEDILASGVSPDDIHVVDLQKVEENANALRVKMSLFYPSEAEQRDAALPLLNKMLMFSIHAGDIGSVRSDGHCDVHGILSTIVEFNNALLGIDAFPHARCVGYVAHSHVNGDRAKDLCGRRRLPSLAMTFVGDLVQFHGVILLGHQYRAVGLTPAFSFSLSTTSAGQYKQLVNAFVAANVLQQRIHRDLESYVNLKLEQDRLRPGDFFFPSVTKIRRYKTDNGANNEDSDYIHFKIFEYHASSGEELFRHRHIYQARVTQPGHNLNSKYLLVKFSQSYSIDLHAFCHGKGHAPKVLGFEPLPGGWFAIAMEFLVADGKPIATDLSPDQCTALEGLVRDFHLQGLVHGDLRSGNILYDDENFWLVDFDWAGKAGEVKYPTWLLHEELLVGRQSKDLTIRKEDDLRILRATLHNLESK